MAGAASVLDKYPQDYETQLGLLFESGVELSVGEWQRIALARAFYRNAPIIVLDEPTSAMDPWAEADWLKRFRKYTAGRTAILITHRFTTAAYADIIHVMENGQIVELGDHQELLLRGGSTPNPGGNKSYAGCHLGRRPRITMARKPTRFPITSTFQHLFLLLRVALSTATPGIAPAMIRLSPASRKPTTGCCLPSRQSKKCFSSSKNSWLRGRAGEIHQVQQSCPAH